MTKQKVCAHAVYFDKARRVITVILKFKINTSSSHKRHARFFSFYFRLPCVKLVSFNRFFHEHRTTDLKRGWSRQNSKFMDRKLKSRLRIREWCIIPINYLTINFTI